jgi:hypothetical protein
MPKDTEFRQTFDQMLADMERGATELRDRLIAGLERGALDLRVTMLNSNSALCQQTLNAFLNIQRFM